MDTTSARDQDCGVFMSDLYSKKVVITTHDGRLSPRSGNRLERMKWIFATLALRLMFR